MCLLLRRFRVPTTDSETCQVGRKSKRKESGKQIYHPPKATREIERAKKGPRKMTTRIIETNQFLKALAALVATVVVTAGLMLVSATTPAHASTTYTVNVLGDQADLKLNDNPNLCDVNQLFGGPQCTLRAAIQEANQTIGPDTITFQIPDNPNIPGAEVKTIEIASALPKITERVTIDGYTQDGASPNNLAKGTNAEIRIELDGSLAETNNGNNARDNLDGLHVSASKTVVKGLAIHSFLDTAIEIEGAATTGVKVKGNFLGTVASGDFGRGGEGVRIGSDGNTVGGSGPATSSPTTSVAAWCSTRTATRCRATS